jgi:CheY-like chemotaxis protein
MRKCIVMVDDDLDMHFIYQKVFQKLGLLSSLRLFENGKDALEYLKRSADDVKIIFSDINMPVMDGIQLRTAINNEFSFNCRTIPFIFLSTSAREREVNSAYELLVQGFFQKGTTIGEIENSITVAIDYWSRCRVPELHPVH